MLKLGLALAVSMLKLGLALFQFILDSMGSPLGLDKVFPGLVPVDLLLLQSQLHLLYLLLVLLDGPLGFGIGTIGMLQCDIKFIDVRLKLLLLPLLLPHPLVFLGLPPFYRDELQTILEAWPLVSLRIQQTSLSMKIQVLQTSELQLLLHTAFFCLHRFLCQFFVHTWRTCVWLGGELL